jgi:hypothetical protein
LSVAACFPLRACQLLANPMACSNGRPLLHVFHNLTSVLSSGPHSWTHMTCNDMIGSATRLNYNSLTAQSPTATAAEIQYGSRRSPAGEALSSTEQGRFPHQRQWQAAAARLLAKGNRRGDCQLHQANSLQEAQCIWHSGRLIRRGRPQVLGRAPAASDQLQ